MTCDDARDQLLEADPDLLRGRGDGALAEHLRACARCAGLARGLLAGQDALDQALVDLSAARAGALTRHVAAPRVRRLPAWARALPWGLAAAAMVALMVAGPFRRPQTSSRASVTAPVLANGDPDVDVSLPAGRSAIVFRTADPTITVVWFY